MDRAPDIALPKDAAALLEALAARGHGSALVGGSVRDALLHRPMHDLDVVTSATPDEVRTACARSTWCRDVYAVGERFGTVGVVLSSGEVVEVSRVRPPATAILDTTVAPAEAHQASPAAFAEALALDAGLRDFTVNALAVLWPSREVLDATGGIADLSARLLRAPMDPQARFAEDPLRTLRAARFVAELDFSLEAETASALADAAPALDRVAPERIREELAKLLVAPNALAGLQVLHDSGALAVVLPEIAALGGVTQPDFHDLDALSHTFQAVSLAPPVRTLRWAALLHDVGKPSTRSVDDTGRIRFLQHPRVGADIADAICRRLRMSNAERLAIVHLVREHMRLGDLPADNPRAVDRAVRRLDLWAGGAIPPRRLVSAEDALEIELADLGATAHRADVPERRRALEEALAASRDRGTRLPPALPLTGPELMRALNIAQGPQVGVALRAIESAIIDGRIPAGDRTAALAVAREALRPNES